MAKEFLSQNNISFEERNVSVDRQAGVELQKRNISGVPTFFIGNDVIVGLDKEKILQLVDHRLVQCPSCTQKLRVPIDKGEIKITCPQCKHQFSYKGGVRS